MLNHTCATSVHWKNERKWIALWGEEKERGWRNWQAETRRRDDTSNINWEIFSSFFQKFMQVWIVRLYKWVVGSRIVGWVLLAAGESEWVSLAWWVFLLIAHAKLTCVPSISSLHPIVCRSQIGANFYRYVVCSCTDSEWLFASLTSVLL